MLLQFVLTSRSVKCVFVAIAFSVDFTSVVRECTILYSV
jgi:hypothetical protein